VTFLFHIALQKSSRLSLDCDRLNDAITGDAVILFRGQSTEYEVHQVSRQMSDATTQRRI
jgi:hypothetical protein